MDSVARQQRIEDIRSWQRAQLDEFDTDSPNGLSEAARGEWVRNAAELARLTQEQTNHIEAMARVGSVEDGAHPGQQTRERTKAAFGTGMRAVERCHERGIMPDRRASELERMLRQDDPQAWGARYLSAVAEPAYSTAFGKVVQDPQHGHLRMDRQEVDAWQRVNALQAERALSVGTGSAGGFAVPIDLDPSILSTGSAGLNPIRQIADVRTTTGYIWKGVSADAPSAQYTAEAAEMGDASPTFIQPTITTARGSAFVPYSFELAGDWPEVANELSNLLMEARFNLDNQKFYNGSGNNEPVGVLSVGTSGALTTAQRVQTGTTATFALADVYSLKQAIGSTKFMTNAVWAFHPNVLDTAFRFVGSGSTSEPQIMPQGRGGDLLGKQVVEWTSLQTGVTTTGNELAVFGDWTGYTIVDRIGTTVEVIPHLFGPANHFPTGQRGLVMWWRAGAGVTKANALRYLEVK